MLFHFFTGWSKKVVLVDHDVVSFTSTFVRKYSVCPVLTAFSLTDNKKSISSMTSDQSSDLDTDFVLVLILLIDICSSWLFLWF